MSETSENNNDVELQTMTHIGLWFHVIVFASMIIGYLINIGRANDGAAKTSTHFLWIPLIVISFVLMMISMIKKKRTKELLLAYTDRETSFHTCPDYFKEEYTDNGKVCKPILATDTSQYTGTQLYVNPVYGNYEYDTNEPMYLNTINNKTSPKSKCNEAKEHPLVKGENGNLKYPWSEVSTKCKHVSNETSPFPYESKGFWKTLYQKLI